MRNFLRSQPHFQLVTRITALLFLLVACDGNDASGEKSLPPKEITKTYEDTLQMTKDSLDIASEYDMKTVDRKHQKEFMENLAKIEKEYGEQWDFCTCIVKNDSINKASMNDMPDEDFDKLMERMDYVDNKCKAFLVQSLNQTPEERYKHEQKVKACLKEAGVE